MDEDFQFNGVHVWAEGKRAALEALRPVHRSQPGHGLGQLYVDQTFGAEGKERTLKMVHAIEDAMHQDIGQLTWMSDTTKQKAYEKLSTVVNNIGYPDKWRDYSTVVVKRDDYAGNVRACTAFEVQRQRNKMPSPPIARTGA